MTVTLILASGKKFSIPMTAGEYRTFVELLEDPITKFIKLTHRNGRRLHIAVDAIEIVEAGQ